MTPWNISGRHGGFGTFWAKRKAAVSSAANPQEADDAKNHILIRDRTCFALLNTYPYNAGHLMVAPYKHTGELDDLVGAGTGGVDGADAPLQTTAHPRDQAARIQHRPEPRPLAGAGVLDHVHIHIVPRWEGDTNFMPVLADTHVVPQALDELYQTLRKHVEGGA